MPRRGAHEVKSAMLDVINNTPCGARRCMSTSEMSRILREEYALPDKDSKKVATQIRKSGPLHHAWKDAFASERFIQKNGRPPGSKTRYASRMPPPQTMMMTTTTNYPENPDAQFQSMAYAQYESSEAEPKAKRFCGAADMVGGASSSALPLPPHCVGLLHHQYPHPHPHHLQQQQQQLHYPLLQQQHPSHHHHLQHHQQQQQHPMMMFPPQWLSPTVSAEYATAAAMAAASTAANRPNAVADHSHFPRPSAAASAVAAAAAGSGFSARQHQQLLDAAWVPSSADPQQQGGGGGGGGGGPEALDTRPPPTMMTMAPRGPVGYGLPPQAPSPVSPTPSLSPSPSTVAYGAGGGGAGGGGGDGGDQGGGEDDGGEYDGNGRVRSGTEPSVALLLLGLSKGSLGPKRTTNDQEETQCAEKLDADEVQGFEARSATVGVMPQLPPSQPPSFQSSNSSFSSLLVPSYSSASSHSLVQPYVSLPSTPFPTQPQQQQQREEQQQPEDGGAQINSRSLTGLSEKLTAFVGACNVARFQT